MATRTLRKIQPAHKSEKITVGQAKQAWLSTGNRASSKSTSGADRTASGHSKTRAASPRPGTDKKR